MFSALTPNDIEDKLNQIFKEARNLEAHMSSTKADGNTTKVPSVTVSYGDIQVIYVHANVN